MKKTIVCLLSFILLAGCSLTPDYMRPDIETPATWSDVKENPAPSQIAYDWWSSFQSDELNGLMAQALENNTDLRAGIQRIEQSRADLKISGASLFPSADGSAGASRSHTNPASGNSSYASALNAGVNVSYEVDLFGANHADVSAAEASYQGSIYDQEALKLSLMGDVATSYFTLASLRERLKISDDNLSNSKEVLRIIQARVDEGAESDLELAQQKSVVASNEATHSSLQEKIIKAENALSVLLGKPPQTMEFAKQNLDGVSVPAIAPEQPSALLQRRPDLLSAEADLIAANADIGAARAAFFPSLSLSLSDGLSLAGFGNPSSTVLTLASSITAPIFQGGRLGGGLEKATAHQSELVETYRGHVLTAFQEVEDALVSVKASQERENAYMSAMEQSRRAFQLSKSRYEAGSIDYQTLLNTQNAQLSAEDSYAQAKLARLIAAVTLYRVLGGGWDS